MSTRKFTIQGKDLTITEVLIIILDVHCDARKHVADILGSSTSTVETHIRNIYQKYDLKGQRDLQRFAYDNELYNKVFFRGEYLFAIYENLPWGATDAPKAA
ncbi:MAG: DNA-binding NarL/FixJ family response regulator [Bacteroidia bacterium]|jgi:DNA-binding NarL/FixJ family response regulator